MMQIIMIKILHAATLRRHADPCMQILRRLFERLDLSTVAKQQDGVPIVAPCSDPCVAGLQFWSAHGAEGGACLNCSTLIKGCLLCERRWFNELAPYCTSCVEGFNLTTG
jgi:hypothetical protein